MRRLVILVSVLGFLGMFALGAAVTLIAAAIPHQQPGGSSCLPTLTAAGDSNGNRGQQQAAALNEEQRSIVAQIMQIGQQRQMAPRAWQIAIQAGKTESNLRNLTYGDRDSLGIFQMRPSMGWGTVAQVTNVEYQINKFYDVLLEVDGWETMQPGTAAQKVERSAYPDRYHKWEEMAAVLVGSEGEIDASGCAGAPPSNESVQRALAFAHEQLGEPYGWGANGPDMWDCSSLMLGAYREAGITLPRVSKQQYHAGQHVPFDQAQPGDLIFWGTGRDPSVIHHVAIYLGDNRVLHAPQPGESVEITNVWDGGELIGTATRPAA